MSKGQDYSDMCPLMGPCWKYPFSTLKLYLPAGWILSNIVNFLVYLLFTLIFLPAGWILRNIVNFLVYLLFTLTFLQAGWILRNIVNFLLYLLFTLTFLPAGWILRNIVNFLVFYHLIKGKCPKICGNWVLLIYLKILTSLLEDYSLDFISFMILNLSWVES